MFEFLGFQVEKLEGNENVAYRFTGKRGGIYNLIRHGSNPKLMYATNRFGNICSIKGNYSFIESKDGKLMCWYGYVILGLV